jgi:cytochrome c551/c552
MDLSKVLLPPDVSHLRLIGPLIVTLEFVFFAFAGVALVSTVLSLAHRKFNSAMARDFARVVSDRASVWVTLGLLPLASLTFLLAQRLFGTRYVILDPLLKLLPLAVVGFGGLWLYRRRLNPLFGGVGVLALVGFVLPFVNLLELIQRPERWPLVDPLAPDMYNAQALARLAIFAVSSLLVTGGALLFLYFVWGERRLPDDAPERPLLRWWGLGLTLVGALALPAAVVWDAAILPAGAQTQATLKAGAPVLAVLWLAALLTLSMLLNGHVRRAALVAGLAFAGLAFEMGRQQVTQTAAIADHLALLQMDAEKEFARIQQNQEAHYPSNTPLGAEAGAKIYGERCSVCHSFDQKVVGPAHKDVLPKYRGQPDKLTAFILNPVKVDPAFPSMPAPGLSRREAGAVAEYLLKRLEEGLKGATP